MTDWNPIAGQDPVDRLDLDEPETYEPRDYGPCVWCGTHLDTDGICQCGKEAGDETV